MTKALGIDFEAKRAAFILVDRKGENVEIGLRDRIELADTRSRAAMTDFKDAVRRIIGESSPDRIVIRAKLENGQMRAGPAALKMEAIILAESPVDVVFVSTVKASKQADGEGMFAYLQPAYKAAMASFEPDTRAGKKAAKAAKPGT